MYSLDQLEPSRVVVPSDADLRARLLHEYHDSQSRGHLGREKTYVALARDFYWPRMYKWIRKWTRSCEVCQHVKPALSSQAPLRPLPVTADAKSSVSLDFVFGFPADATGNTGAIVFADRFSKMVHLAPVTENVTSEQTAELFLDVVFRQHGLSSSLVSDRDPRLLLASGTISSSCWELAWICRPRTIPRRMGRRSESAASSKTYCGVMPRRTSRGASSCRWSSSRSTTRFMCRLS